MNLPGGMELLIVVGVLVLLFGASRVPKMARSMGQARKEFSAGLKEGQETAPVAGFCPFCKQDVPDGARFCPGCARTDTEVVAARDGLTASRAG